MNTATIAAHRVGYEIRSYFRAPDTVFFTFLFPIVMLALFSVAFSSAPDIGPGPGASVDYATYYLPGLVATGILLSGTQSLGVDIAGERSDGTLKRLGGTPLPVVSYFIGKIGMVLVTTIVQTALLLAIASLVFGVDLPTDGGAWARFAGIMLLGVATSCVLGIAISALPREGRRATATIVPWCSSCSSSPACTCPSPSCPTGCRTSQARSRCAGWRRACGRCSCVAVRGGRAGRRVAPRYGSAHPGSMAGRRRRRVPPDVPVEPQGRLMPAVGNARSAAGRWDAGAMDRTTAHRNWGLHVAVGVTIALVAVIAALDWSPWSTRWPAFTALGVLAIAYVGYGWRGYETPRAAAGFVPLLVAVALVLPAVVPSTAFIQCVLFPVAWCQVERVRAAVAVSVLIGVASGVGLQIASGPSGLVGTLLVESISVAGACALGLWITRIAGLSDERRQLIDELRATQDSLAEAHRRAGVTSERERLARELHDTVAQNLAGIVMLTERARRDLANDRGPDLEERLTVLEESARAALEDSRALIAAGVAGATTGSLAGSLHRLAERFTRETGTPVTVDATDGPLDRDAQVVLLRVVQESLANVRAHAGADSVRVVLSHSPERVGVRVTDDGVGFDAGAPLAGHGSEDSTSGWHSPAAPAPSRAPRAVAPSSKRPCRPDPSRASRVLFVTLWRR